MSPEPQILWSVADRPDPRARSASWVFAMWFLQVVSVEVLGALVYTQLDWTHGYRPFGELFVIGLVTVLPVNGVIFGFSMLFWVRYFDPPPRQRLQYVSLLGHTLRVTLPRPLTVSLYESYAAVVGRRNGRWSVTFFSDREEPLTLVMEASDRADVQPPSPIHPRSRRLRGGTNPHSVGPLVEHDSVLPPDVQTECGPVSLTDARSAVSNQTPRADFVSPPGWEGQRDLKLWAGPRNRLAFGDALLSALEETAARNRVVAWARRLSARDLRPASEPFACVLSTDSAPAGALYRRGRPSPGQPGFAAWAAREGFSPVPGVTLTVEHLVVDDDEGLRVAFPLGATTVRDEDGVLCLGSTDRAGSPMEVHVPIADAALRVALASCLVAVG